MIVALLVAYNIRKKQFLTKETKMLDEDDVRNYLEAEAYEEGGEKDKHT